MGLFSVLASLLLSGAEGEESGSLLARLAEAEAEARAGDLLPAPSWADLSRVRIGDSAFEPGLRFGTAPTQEDDPTRKTDPTLDPLFLDRAKDLPWIDFDWFELTPRVGVAMFTEDFRIDPTPVFALQVHVPIPLLSPSSNAEGDYFGLFVQASIMNVDRDLDPKPSGADGNLIFFTGGLDYTFVRNQGWYWTAKVGFQYASYGGVADLTDGTAPLVGTTMGLYLGSGLTVTLGPEVVFGHAGDRIDFLYLGLLIEF